jgi:hypothetical protein
MEQRIEVSGATLLGVSRSHIYLDVKTVACYVEISYLSCVYNVIATLIL